MRRAILFAGTAALSLLPPAPADAGGLAACFTLAGKPVWNAKRCLRSAVQLPTIGGNGKVEQFAFNASSLDDNTLVEVESEILGAFSLHMLCTEFAGATPSNMHYLVSFDAPEPPIVFRAGDPEIALLGINDAGAAFAPDSVASMAALTPVRDPQCLVPPFLCNLPLSVGAETFHLITGEEKEIAIEIRATHSREVGPSPVCWSSGLVTIVAPLGD